MTKFNLITGFLGSGKTTFLDNLLNELLPETKIAVIQNEFAPSGVDGKELQRSNGDFKLLEINNGSVFCVCQLANFEQALLKCLDDYEPEQIFLEASGLADPISVIDLLNTENLRGRITLDRVICLLDAVNFSRGLNKLERVRHQLMVADKVIINKTDLYDGDLEEIHQAVRALNPFAKCTESVHASVKWDVLAVDDEVKSRAAGRYSGKRSAGRPQMAACVLRTHKLINIADLRRFLESLQAECPRIKGYIKLKDGGVVSVQSVYESLEIREIHGYEGPSELIAFGNDLTREKLRKSFQQACL